jgi:hypothetical protein
MGGGGLDEHGRIRLKSILGKHCEGVVWVQEACHGMQWCGFVDTLVNLDIT